MRQRAVGAIQLMLLEWMDRPHGSVLYKMTQVLTGHGCFGENLARIEKKPSPECHYCEAGLDSAQHTLAVCPAWAVKRAARRWWWGKT